MAKALKQYWASLPHPLASISEIGPCITDNTLETVRKDGDSDVHVTTSLF